MTTGGHFRGRRVLVSGGLGFLGSHVATRLLGEGAQVTVVDALVPGHGGSRQHLDDHPDLVVLHGDLRDEATVARAVDGVCAIFHLAGASGHRRSMTAPLEDLSLNAAATASLLAAWAKGAPEARVVLASTRQVYGRARGPLTEAHPVEPRDVNGVSKHASEELLRVFDRSGKRGTALRLTNAYGARMPLSEARGHVLGSFFRRALRGEMLEVFRPGSDRRSFVHAEDVAAAFLAAASSDECGGQRLNVGGSPPCSIRALAELVGEIAGVAVREVAFPEELRTIDVGDHPIDDTAFRCLTGWRPRWELRDGLRATFEALAAEASG